MKQYVTFHEIMTEFENWQKQSPIMNSFGFGNLVDFGNTIDGEELNKPVEYPFMFVVPQSITYEENTTNYQLSILFADLLNTDLSNQMDCVSDMSLQARRFLSAIKRGIVNNPEMYEIMDLDLPTSGIPFLERMADNVAGIALNCYITVFEDINDCDFYPTPTPTPTPSATPATPTPTPSSTPTPTPSPNPKFDAGDGFSNTTYSIYVDQSTNDVYVGGIFRYYKDDEVNNLVKIDDNGDIVPSFTAYTNNLVGGIHDDGLGYLYIYGSFTQVNGQTANRICRISKTTGAVDPNWVGITGFNNVPFNLIIDGTDIIVVGSFTTFNGVTVNRICRISNTGVLDTTAFTDGINIGFTTASSPYGLLKNRNGNYVVSGNLGSYLGGTTTKIIEIDSTTWADTGLFLATSVDTRQIYQDSNNGDYYWMQGGGTVNGTAVSKINRCDESASSFVFTSIGGVPMLNCWYDETNQHFYGTYIQAQPTADYYFRVDTSGPTLVFDSTFNNNIRTISVITSLSQNYRVVDVNSNNKVYFVGDFDQVCSTRAPFIFRLNSDGTSNTI